MIINIVLLFLVFGATKKKLSPYTAAVILGAIKGGLYFVGSQSILAAVIAYVIFAGLAAGLVYFLARVDLKEMTEEPYPTYTSRKKSPFKWEYIPLSAIVALLIFGESVAVMFIR
jgi:hypothetical protein